MKQYRCRIENCKLVFDRPSKLSRHELLHTGIKKYRCPAEDCIKTYSTPSHLNRHMKSHKTNLEVQQSFRCSYSYCQRIFNTKWGLKRHEMNHKNANYCVLCNTYFKHNATYLKHMKQHYIKWSQTCRKCGKSYIHTTYQKYLRHEISCGQQPLHLSRVNDPEEIFCCDRCGSQFTKKINIQEHVILCYSLSSSVFICGHQSCPKLFFYKRNLMYHINRHHVTVNYNSLDEGSAVVSKTYADPVLPHLSAAS